eukprot:3932120-Rhodomonas_salina.4
MKATMFRMVRCPCFVLSSLACLLMVLLAARFCSDRGAVHATHVRQRSYRHPSSVCAATMTASPSYSLWLSC